MDRYGLAREFELRKFEMQVMNMTDLYHAGDSNQAIQSDDQPTKVYEAMLRDMGRLPPGRNLRTCG